MFMFIVKLCERLLKRNRNKFYCDIFGFVQWCHRNHGSEDISSCSVVITLLSCSCLLAGANMSGDLKNPSFAIPVGTIGACIFTFVIYALISEILHTFVCMCMYVHVCMYVYVVLLELGFS